MARTLKNVWITNPRQNSEAQMRLFCFPYAGGGASAYHAWISAFPPTIEVRPVQFPGRESRLLEPLFTNMNTLVEALAAHIAPFLDKPFVFFGHSMGGLICFELTRYLYQKWGLLPQTLFVSAHRAPHLPGRHEPIHQLSDTVFLQRINEFNGTPEEILNNTELMSLLLPTLRADFTLCETYRYVAHDPLPCPISVFGGTEDEEVNYEELTAWNSHTRGPFMARQFSGNHFFLYSSFAQLIQAIREDLLSRTNIV